MLYSSFIVNVFHAKETPMEVADAIRRALKDRLTQDETAVDTTVEVRVDEHSGGCDLNICGETHDYK